jgi:hypothetical protein
MVILIGAGAAVLESNNHSVCASGLGQLGQALSEKLVHECATTNTVFFGGIAIALIGGLSFFVAAVGGALRYRR